MTKDRTMTIAVDVPCGKAIFCDECNTILYFDPNKNKEIINDSIKRYSLDNWWMKEDYISKDRYIIGLHVNGMPITYHDCCCNTECICKMISRLKEEVNIDSKSINSDNEICYHTITMEFMPGDDKNYEEG